MKFTNKLSRIWTGQLLALFAFAVLCLTGCTVSTGGMTLPNPFYHMNPPQYFPKGSEFPFPNEAANLQDMNQDF